MRVAWQHERFCRQLLTGSGRSRISIRLSGTPRGVNITGLSVRVVLCRESCRAGPMPRICRKQSFVNRPRPINCGPQPGTPSSTIDNVGVRWSDSASAALHCGSCGKHAREMHTRVYLDHVPTGIAILNVVPSPTADSTLIDAPIACTQSRTIARPRPTPSMALSVCAR